LQFGEIEHPFFTEQKKHFAQKREEFRLLLFQSGRETQQRDECDRQHDPFSRLPDVSLELQPGARRSGKKTCQQAYSIQNPEALKN
jgi:hypothetical protein